VFFTTLLMVYERVRELGLTKSQRHFSTAFLSGAPTYMNDFAAKGRGHALVPRWVVDDLKERLVAVLEHLPGRVIENVRQVVALIDAGIRTASLLARGGGSSRNFNAG
jgi:DNA-binding transcriptional LysR family regulator